LGDQRPVGARHVERGEKAPVRAEQFENIGSEPVDAGPVEHARERARLLLGGKYGATQQAGQIGDLGHERIEAIEIDFDAIEGVLFARELEKRGRVATRHAGNDCMFPCHKDALPAIPRARHRRGRLAPSP
jgi:hypothetical protein